MKKSSLCYFVTKMNKLSLFHNSCYIDCMNFICKCNNYYRAGVVIKMIKLFLQKSNVLKVFFFKFLGKYNNYPFFLLKFDYYFLYICSFKNTTHQDFVQGLCWSRGHKLLSCGWDSLVLTHDLSGLKNMQSSETVSVKVNGHQVGGNDIKTEHYEKTSCCEEKISSIPSSDSIQAK